MITSRHQILIDALRSLSKTEEYKEIGEKFSEFSDQEIVDLFFKNKSNKQKSNITSLSQFGLKILMSCFASWEITLPKPLTTKQHILLMNGCKLPYFVDDKRFITFEQSIGVMLKLSEGNNDYIEQMFEH